MVFDDGGSQLNDDDNGLDEKAFVLVVLEVGAEVVEAVVSVLLEVGRNENRGIPVE